MEYTVHTIKELLEKYKSYLASSKNNRASECFELMVEDLQKLYDSVKWHAK